MTQKTPLLDTLSAKGVVQNRMLNYVGLQAFRVLVARAGSLWRRSRQPSRNEVEAGLRSRGFCVIRDFLPPEVFSQTREEYWRIMRDDAVVKQRQRDTRGYVRETHYLDAESPAHICSKKIRNNSDLRRLLCVPDGVKESRFQRAHFQAAFWRHRVDDGSIGEIVQSDHTNAEFHSDTFFSIAKAFFYVEPCTVENGAHRFVPRSHRLTINRLIFEHLNAVSEARDSPRVQEDEIHKYGDAPIEFELPENSLIVENTFGFHAAGLIRPAMERNLVYLQLRWPPFGSLTRAWRGN